MHSNRSSQAKLRALNSTRTVYLPHKRMVAVAVWRGERERGREGERERGREGGRGGYRKGGREGGREGGRGGREGGEGGSNLYHSDATFQSQTSSLEDAEGIPWGTADEL